ncbi:MAG: pyridoxamine 5'-phosphate oxidase family protein [Candidatus Omnitrophica bacterium]|nr:pyridoxamine 5'-phosphate oxidase family protein [Candidatus Omnitrophota bacterium]
MIISGKVKDLFEKEPLITFGTADKQGNPNVVPVFWKKIVGDETIILVDNYMKMSKENLLENSNVCISFWNSETGEAYKIKGEAAYYTKGEIYEEGKKFIQTKKPETIPKGVVEIKLKEIYTIKPGVDAGKKLD